MWTSLLIMTLLLPAARATVDDKCDALLPPDDYDEQVQRDFLANYVVLATTYSAIHAPIPHAAGRGAVGLDLAVIPPLGCGQRYVEDWSKTEDTNKAPVVPRPRATFGFEPIADRIYPYAGVALIPPIFIGGKKEGSQNFIASGEFGAGMYLSEHLAVGLRLHGTLQRTVSNAAGAYEKGDKEYYDVYVASSQGVDLSAGYSLGDGQKLSLTPYVSAGLLDTSTFLWIGDDGFVGTNYHPYLGPAISLGADGLLKDRIRLGAEIYAAPGGHSKPNESVPDVEEGAFTRYGNLYTARLRIAYEL